MLLMFYIWSTHLVIGVFWLYITVVNKIIHNYNTVGSLILIVLWPIHVFYLIIKKMKITNWFKNPFKRKIKVTEEEKKAFGKIILDVKNKDEIKKKKYTSKESYQIDEYLFNVGDKVICRTNEPYPLLVGKIVEFWDNEGKWEKVVPVVRNIRTGKKFNVHGIIKPYSTELLNILKPMKPLEQWNYFVPEDVRYTEEEMKRKEEAFSKREKVLPNKK